jgi:hypothetical protein
MELLRNEKLLNFVLIKSLILFIKDIDKDG